MIVVVVVVWTLVYWCKYYKKGILFIILESMSHKYPVITIQCDWNDVVKLPNLKAWISSKYLNQTSVHDQLTTTLNQNDSKVRINLPEAYQLISTGTLSLALKHLSSGLKIVFVAPTKVHSVHNKAALSISASENALAVSSCEADKLLVWDSRTGDVLFDLKGHGGPVYKCRYFPSGVVVISAGADGSCRIWSAESGINPVTLKGHKMAVMDLTIVGRGRNVISVSRDGTAKLWDVGESNCLANIVEGVGAVNCCTLISSEEVFNVNNEREVETENKLLVVGCESGIVICSHLAKREQLFSKHLDAACNSCATLENSVIIGCSDGKIVQLDIRNGSIMNEWHESANPVLSVTAITQNLFAAGRQDGTCTLYSTLEPHSATRLQLTGSDCDGIRDISFNGKWIFVACRDSKIRKYDYNQVIVHFR